MNRAALGMFLALAHICYGPACFGQEAWVTQTWIQSGAAQLPAADVQSLLSQICPGHGHASGCDPCPPGTGSPWGSWELRAIFLGHFVSPSSQDALVSGFGCESHADGVGGSFLFTKNGSSWSRLRYAAGMLAWDCKKLTGSDGRDRLISGIVDGNQGHMFSSLFLIDPGQDRSAVFFGVEDTTGSIEPRQQRGVIERVEFGNPTADHQVRITIFARLGWANVPAGIVEKGAALQGPEPNVATIAREYEFVFDGSGVQPDPNNPPSDGKLAIAPETGYSLGR